MDISHRLCHFNAFWNPSGREKGESSQASTQTETCKSTQWGESKEESPPQYYLMKTDRGVTLNLICVVTRHGRTPPPQKSSLTLAYPSYMFYLEEIKAFLPMSTLISWCKYCSDKREGRWNAPLPTPEILSDPRMPHLHVLLGENWGILV